MYQIPQNRVRKWMKHGEAAVPLTFRERCPRCDELVVFTCEGYTEYQQGRVANGYAVCPNCDRKVTIVSLADIETPAGLIKSHTKCYMHPAPRVHSSIVIDEQSVPGPLAKALQSTEDSYSSKNYVATAVGARRALEGIFKYLVADGDRKLPLAQLIRVAKDKADLAAPLTALSEAIRDGGNLGAHFDPDAEPTQEIALQMVELLKYLTEYLYVLPVKIRDLEASLGRSRPPEQLESASTD